MIISYNNKQIAIEQNDHIRGIDIVREHFPDDLGHILCMSCDTELQSLNNVIPSSVSRCCFYDINDTLGSECLAVSTTALMLMAAEGLFHDTRISIEHSLERDSTANPLVRKRFLKIILTSLNKNVFLY